jgi:demethoxyubiquinone hydroxylase (CLK1/Coq7/Cat5 family)
LKGDAVDQAIDLKREQEVTLARPRYSYSSGARFFFRSMDTLAGKEESLPKVRVIESLASIPYRAWESRQYGRIQRHYGEPEVVRDAEEILRYGRAAQDNEVQHLRIIEEKLRREAVRDPRYMTRPLPELMSESYNLFSATLSRLGIRRAFMLNAEFEDHAEHTYAELVTAHPEWEEMPVEGDAVKEYAAYHGLDGFDNWADVFRRIGLDERDHRNASFAFAGMPELVAAYEGMPGVPGLGEQEAA